MFVYSLCTIVAAFSDYNMRLILISEIQLASTVNNNGKMPQHTGGEGWGGRPSLGHTIRGLKRAM